MAAKMKGTRVFTTVQSFEINDDYLVFKKRFEDARIDGPPVVEGAYLDGPIVFNVDHIVSFIPLIDLSSVPEPPTGIMSSEEFGKVEERGQKRLMVVAKLLLDKPWMAANNTEQEQARQRALMILSELADVEAEESQEMATKVFRELTDEDVEAIVGGLEITRRHVDTHELYGGIDTKATVKGLEKLLERFDKEVPL